MNDNYLKIFDKLFFNTEKNEDVKAILNEASDVIASLIIKYGEIENEIAFGITRKNPFVDKVVCLFIRKIMGQLDAINVLFSIGSVSELKILFRSLIENIVSLEFILKEDIEFRAATYYYEYNYREIYNRADSFNPKSEIGKWRIENFGDVQFEKDKEKYIEKKAAFWHMVNSNEIYKLVKKKKGEKIEEKRNKLQKTGRVYVQWYEICGEISSFRQLMKAVGYEKFYKGIYEELSHEIHALNSAEGMVSVDNTTYIDWIRNPRQAGFIFPLVCDFSLGALTKIYDYLGLEKEDKEEYKNYFLEYQKNKHSAIKKLDSIK